MHIIALSFPIVKVGIKCFQFRLQVLVPWDPVVPLEKERLDHRGQLHVEVKEVDRECDYEECKSSGHKIK